MAQKQLPPALAARTAAAPAARPMPAAAAAPAARPMPPQAPQMSAMQAAGGAGGAPQLSAMQAAAMKQAAASPQGQAMIGAAGGMGPAGGAMGSAMTGPGAATGMLADPRMSTQQPMGGGMGMAQPQPPGMAAMPTRPTPPQAPQPPGMAGAAGKMMPGSPMVRPNTPQTMKAGGAVKMAKGGSIGGRGDGCAQRGKTRGKMV